MKCKIYLGLLLVSSSLLFLGCNKKTKDFFKDRVPSHAIIMATQANFSTQNPPEDVAYLKALLDIKTRSGEANPLVIAYPNDSSVFPPEIVPPTLTWDNPALEAKEWLLEFHDLDSGKISIWIPSSGPPPFVIDPEAIPSDRDLALHRPETMETWTIPNKLWTFLKSQTVEKYCEATLSGFARDPNRRLVTSGRFCFKTSRDSVGAPIFYRDVPFMPVLQKGADLILPLDKFAMQFIRWRLRDISRFESKVILKDMPTCANCHTFSKDGKTMGLDIDGTKGDKGAYGIQKVSRQMVIDRKDLVSWNYDFKGKRKGSTFGFLSSLAPDGNTVVTTVNEELFIVGYMDPGFLQVFYPTKGILAFYSREKHEARALPGADDSNFVHCSPTWTPDGKYIIFSRAKAKDPFVKNQKMPARANDSEETPIQYDLYKMPFNNGRGGLAVPIVGASNNGKSNSFAKVTPDGKYLIWVQARNGLLMRPDSKLWIVPVEGGTPRLMNCNTSRMNSWHSISPNNRWMVFSSKQFSLYTQLFLTHLDENGKDSPYILLPNSTADNRASNLPEFANINYNDLDHIDVPAISHFRYRLKADKLITQGKYAEAIDLLRKALDEEKQDRLMRADMLATLGELLDDDEEATQMLLSAIKEDPRFPQAYLLLGQAYNNQGKEKEAIQAILQCLQMEPNNYLAMVQLAVIYLTAENPGVRDLDKALYYALKGNEITYYHKAYLLQNLARILSEKGRFSEAVEYAKEGIQRALDVNDKDRAEKLENEMRAFMENVKFTSLIERKPKNRP